MKEKILAKDSLVKMDRELYETLKIICIKDKKNVKGLVEEQMKKWTADRLKNDPNFSNFLTRTA